MQLAVCLLLSIVFGCGSRSNESEEIADSERYQLDPMDRRSQTRASNQSPHPRRDQSTHQSFGQSTDQQGAAILESTLRECESRLDSAAPGSKDLLTTERQLQTALIEYPNEPRLYETMTRLHVLRDGDIAAARWLAEACPLSVDGRARLIVIAAGLFVRGGAEHRGLELLKAEVKRAPDDLDLRRHYARILNERGYRHAANQQIRLLMPLEVISIRELTGLFNPARTYITFATKPDRLDAGQHQKYGSLSIALALRGRGALRESLECLDAAPPETRSHPAAQAMRGQLLAAVGDRDEFRRWLKTYQPQLESEPDFWMALGTFARTSLLSASQISPSGLATAESCFLQVLELEPNYVQAVEALQATRAQRLETQSASTLMDEVDLKTPQKQIVQLSELQWLAQQIHSRSQIDPGLVERLTKLLVELDRPLEALAWHETIVSSMDPLNKSLAEIKKQKRIFRQSTEGTSKLSKFGSPTPIDVAAMIAAFVDRGNVKDGRDTASPSTAATSPLSAKYVDIAERAGIDFRYRNATEPVSKYFQLFQAFGGGVACIDYDLDGWIDLYLGQAGSSPPHGISQSENRLLRNVGGRAIDVTDSTRILDVHYSIGVTAGDLNQDGFDDLLTANVGSNSIWINQGDGTYAPCPGAEEMLDSHFSMSLAVADVSGDHLPDIVEVNYLDDPGVFAPIETDANGRPLHLPGPLHYRPAVDQVLVAQGDGGYQSSPLGEPHSQSAATGMGLVIGDLHPADGNEIYISNDQMANQLWIQNRTDLAKARWHDLAASSGLAVANSGHPTASMGIAADDFNNDGRIDFHVTNFLDESSNQYIQVRPGLFADQAASFGIDRLSLQKLGFGTQAIDYDNNGSVDLFVCNGHIEDYSDQGKPFRMRPQLLTWDGAAMGEADLGDSSRSFWSTARLSRSVATLDWNRDGKPDLAVSDLEKPFSLLENQIESDNAWISIELVGTDLERAAIGAQVTVRSGERQFVRFCKTGDGYACRNEPYLHFGLGNTGDPVDVRVDWPQGGSQTFKRIPLNSRLLVVQQIDTVHQR